MSGSDKIRRDLPVVW